jgi:organic radical activating enzyme
LSNDLKSGYEIFPIKSDTACMLKWGWSSIFMSTGETSSCHRVEREIIDPDNFQNFHNTPAKKLAREQMLQGKWPGKGCEYCENVEKAGGTSDRILTLSGSHQPDKVPPELFYNPYAIEVTPIILEIYFNNTCNMSCLYCSPIASSQINDEIRRFGTIEINDFKISSFKSKNKKYDKMIQDLWEYLIDQERYKTIRHYHILGGEPLLQKELDASIDFWNDHPNPSLSFNIITNLMIPHQKFVEKIEKFQKLVGKNSIYKLEITASIDCWGEQSEYVRHGLDLKTWTENFEYLLDKPWIHLAIHSCLSSLSIKTLPDLLKKINQWNHMRAPLDPIDHSFDSVLGNSNNLIAMHPKYFDKDVFQFDFLEILSEMPSQTDRQKNAIKHMKGLFDFIENHPADAGKISMFKKYLDEIDRRRQSNWRSIFPWLDQL